MPHVGEKILASIMALWPRFARHGVCGLPRAFRAMKGWRKVCPAKSRSPLALCVWAALANEMTRNLDRLECLYMLLSLIEYFRPREGLSVKRKHLLAPIRGVCSWWTIMLNPQEEGSVSKAGEMDDGIVMDCQWMPWIGAVLRPLKEGNPDGYVFPFSYPSFLAKFNKAAATLNIKGLVPYQWRHSGASIDASKRSRTILEIQQRGRWKSFKSVARYEKHGRLATSAQNLPRGLLETALSCEARLEDTVTLGRCI